MKSFVFFFIFLGLAMSLPQPANRDPEDLENQMAGMCIILLL